ncbi:MAG: PIG-L family deacetylase [Chloroflexi bacterium]|nr:PIG-L family deacetylase [Chloroflexota bacterium]
MAQNATAAGESSGRRAGTGALRILVFGAHPDDCESRAGGTAALWAAAGHRVRFVSLTNGVTGHHAIGGLELARRRAAEAQAAAAVIGIEYVVLDNPSGALEASLERRREVIRLMREFQPDLVLGPRPWDYHPDHRYTGVLIQDAAYVVTVPNNEPLTPHLERNPHIMYVHDTFRKPLPFAPDIAVAIDDVVAQKLRMLHAHTSQMYEWLPYNAGVLDEVPPTGDEAARLQWLSARRLPAFAAAADRYRDVLIRWYGPERGNAVRYAEAFEACEYGAFLDEPRLRRLFPFVG